MEIPVFRYNPNRKIGFAFVTVDVALVEEVLKFNDEEMMGRKLKVALGKPKDQSKPDKWQKKPEKAGVRDECGEIKLLVHGLTPSNLLCIILDL